MGIHISHFNVVRLGDVSNSRYYLCVILLIEKVGDIFSWSEEFGGKWRPSGTLLQLRLVMRCGLLLPGCFLFLTHIQPRVLWWNVRPSITQRGGLQM